MKQLIALFLCIVLLRYGDRWYISTLNSISAIICNVPLTNCALCKLSDL